LCSPSVKAQNNLTDDNVKFLKSCNTEQDDIDVIAKLPSDGKDSLELVLESSRRNCNMETIKSSKVTRDFLKKYTSPPERCLMPPKGYSNNFLTTEENKYIDDINKKILDKILVGFSK